MIEMHTKIFCQCGKRFFHLLAADELPLAREVKIECRCPDCGTKNQAKYDFDAEFLCIDQQGNHHIADHFSHNQGNTNEETYPRQCVCGQEILLKQIRKG